MVTVNENDDVNKPKHLPKIDRYVYLLCLMAAIGGLLFGYDTGVVSSAMLYIPNNAGMGSMSAIWKEVIVSITPGMAGVSSVIAGPTSDYFGRKRIIVVASVVFSVGAFLCAGAPERYTLLVGRMLLGVAIGFASMIVPIYVGEASPSHIRGRLVTCFQIMITLGFVVANVLAGAFSYFDPTNIGWRLMVGFAAIPSIIQFGGFLFLPESPRWLSNNKREREAIKVLADVYANDQEWIDYEMSEIRQARQQELKDKDEYGGGPTIFRVLKTPHVRKALAIGCMLQMFQQLSGINTIMFYTGTIIRSAGIRDNHTTIWISCGTAIVNFVCTFIPLYLIERVGRRTLLMSSVGGVITSLLLIGGGFLLINKDTNVISANYTLAGITSDQYNVTIVQNCLKYTNCDYCVTDERCGYCAPNAVNISITNGQCVPVNPDNSELAHYGYCADQSNIDGTLYEFADNYCKTKYTVLPIVLMVVYISFFSSGYGPIPWVCNAEFYPLWARSTCVSLATATNWLFNLIISFTFLTLTEAITKFGAFFLYACITSIAFVLFYVLVPETKGCQIEEVELLFMSDAKRRDAQQMLRHRRSKAMVIDKDSTAAGYVIGKNERF